VRATVTQHEGAQLRVGQVPPEGEREQEGVADLLGTGHFPDPLAEHPPACVGQLVDTPVAGSGLSRGEHESVGGHAGQLPVYLAACEAPEVADAARGSGDEIPAGLRPVVQESEQRSDRRVDRPPHPHVQDFTRSILTGHSGRYKVAA